MFYYRIGDVEVEERLVGHKVIEYHLSKQVAGVLFCDTFKKVSLDEANLIRITREFSREVERECLARNVLNKNVQ
ncbi:hypothetical protein NVP1293O_01 [Vibrio phage 1.293.O._10N.261.52.E1]|nr:hypothetical protein NVP1293O_01 [Vibrio phage 1.293.O._10N.261.52.E1]